MEEKLSEDVDKLLKKSEWKENMKNNQVDNAIGIKLDTLSNILKFHPYDTNGKHLKAFKPGSEKEIEPAYAICPASMECQTLSCSGHYLFFGYKES